MYFLSFPQLVSFDLLVYLSPIICLCFSKTKPKKTIHIFLLLQKHKCVEFNSETPNQAFYFLQKWVFAQSLRNPNHFKFSCLGFASLQPGSHVSPRSLTHPGSPHMHLWPHRKSRHHLHQTWAARHLNEPPSQTSFSNLIKILVHQNKMHWAFMPQASDDEEYFVWLDQMWLVHDIMSLELCLWWEWVELTANKLATVKY